MLQFLAPLWLLALPLAGLPWFWPIVRRPRNTQWFSSFLLIPPTDHRKKFLLSKEEFLVKLLRTFIIALMVLLLSRPFWKEEGNPMVVWVVDDSFSSTFSSDWGQGLPDVIPELSTQTVWKLSELAAFSSQTPLPSPSSDLEKATYSPNLAWIEMLILERMGDDIPGGVLEVNLVSDFQKKQYQYYQTASQKISWHFHPSQPDLQKIKNLSLGALELGNAGLFEFQLKGELLGNIAQAHPVNIQVHQGEKLLLETSLQWQGKSPQAFEIGLPASMDRLSPIEVQLVDSMDSVPEDNLRYVQWNRRQNRWVAMITSEGGDGVYRHGLHQLKAALNANHHFSYVNTSKAPFEQQPPDLLFLLGDHPIRWNESFQEFTPKLFIPSRLGDWQAFAQQHSAPTDGTRQHYPESQWIINWEQVPFAEEWKIQKVSPYLYYSETWKLWMLATGVSPSWGALYQDVRFANLMEDWINRLLEEEQQQFLGGLQSKRLASHLRELTPHFEQWKPGHYQVEDAAQNKTFHFSVNYPTQESDVDFFSAAELEAMQDYFAQRAGAQEEHLATPSAQQFRDLLLWFLFAFIFLELAYVFIKLFRSPAQQS